MIEKIYDINTEETIEREYSAAQKKEVADYEAKMAENAKIQEAIANDKAALLLKLGITEDEAKLLLS